MAKYYPKSQIIPNLFTSGDEFILSNNSKEYIGDYYSTSDGLYFTGKNPQNGESKKLIKSKPPIPQLKSDSDVVSDNLITISTFLNPNIDIGDNDYSLVEEYMNLHPSAPLTKKPTPYFPILNSKNYTEGKITRYFCKSNKNFSYFEINKKDFKQLKDKNPKISFELFTPCKLEWILTGERKEVFLQNEGTVSLIERNKKWFGFTQYFKNDFDQFYSDSIDNISTQQNPTSNNTGVGY